MTEASEVARPSEWEAPDGHAEADAGVLELDTDYSETTGGQPRCTGDESKSREEGQQQEQQQNRRQQEKQHLYPLTTITTTDSDSAKDSRGPSQQTRLYAPVNKAPLDNDVTQQQQAGAAAAAPSSTIPVPPTTSTSIHNVSPITPSDNDVAQLPLPFVAPSHYLRRQRSSDTHTLGKDNPTPASTPTERLHSTISSSIPSIIQESVPQSEGKQEQQPLGRDNRGRDKEVKSGIGWALGREKELRSGRAAAARKMPIDSEQHEGLRIIRAFLKVRTSYDVLPLSFRLIVFDTALLVKKSLNILIQNGIVSAPLWDSKTSTFAGLLTVSDYINVIQYYVQNPDSLSTIDQFRLNSLRDIEKAIGVQPLETISAHPMQPLYTACRRMLESRARRIPLVDVDDETNRSMVVSVVTQYRILKFVAVNVKETQMLRKRLGDIRCVTCDGLQTARMETSVMDVIQIFVKYSISSVPILDDEGCLVNVFEAVDVIALIKGGVYDDLSLTVGEALLKRSDDFPGIFTCTLNDRLDSIFDTIRKSRVHRFVVIDEEKKLVGLLTLSDILEYILLEGVDEDKD